MHQPHIQSAQRETMGVLVMVTSRVVTALPDMGVGMKVLFAVVMMMGVEMYLVSDHSSQDIESEYDEHDAHQEFERLCQLLGQNGIEDQYDRAKREQR